MKILIYLLPLFVFAKTIVVDENAFCFPFIGCFGACESGDYVTDTIGDALYNAQNGDVIEICPGTYYESNLRIDKNLIIKGLGNSPDDVTVEDSSSRPIFYTYGWRNGLTIENIKVVQDKNNKIALKIAQGTDFLFKDLNISSKGYGFYFTGNIQNSDLNNTTVDASSSKDCIYIYNTTGGMNFSNLILKNCKKGIYFKNNSVGDFNFEGISFDNVQEYGVDASAVQISNNVYVKNCNVDGKNTLQKAFYFEKITGKIEFTDNNISNVTEYGLRVDNVSSKGTITNNIFSNCGEKCLYFLDTQLWRGYDVTNNCFYGSDNDTYAFNRDKDADFNGNYWEYLNDGDKFEIPDIPVYDTSPLPSCPNNSNENTLKQCFFDDFNRNDLGDKWKIIKSKNFTPKIENEQLYLTDNSDSISSGVTLVGKFPAKNNYVVVEFEENAYGKRSSQGADGVAIVFSDASVEPVAGAFGGSLGYAQKQYGISDCDDPNGCPGFAGGWLGIGLDEYGNYSNPTEGREGGPGRRPDSVAIRGRGNGLDGYEYIDGTGTLSPGIDDNKNNTGETDNRYTSSSPLHYKYKIIFDTRNGKTLVKIYRDTGGGYKLILSTDASSNGEPPEYFRFSLTGSTGGANNYHTFDNIKISALNCGSLGEETKTSKFDAWDDFRNEKDRNISIKIADKEFNLTLAEYNGSSYTDNFNGTVCSVVYDEDSKKEVSEWNATWWKSNDDKNKTDISFTVKKAVKKAKIYIYWIENRYETNDSCEGLFEHAGNESSSTDDFSVRPLKFDISMPSKIIAAQKFNFDVKAEDYKNNPTDDYNQSGVNVSWKFSTLKKCNNIDLNLSSISFKNGISENSAKIKDIGEINITVRDASFDEAEGEEEECNSSSECIEKFGFDGKDLNNVYCCNVEGNVSNIVIIPSYFKLDLQLKNFDNNFTYIDTNNTHIYGFIDYNITAKNEDNQTTLNYNKECYAKNIDTNLSYKFYVKNSEVSRAVDTLNYTYTDADSNKTDSVKAGDAIELNLSKDNFTTDNNGSAEIKIYFNFDKNISNPVSPFEFNITDVNISDGNVRDKNLTVNSNVLFYYGRLITQDVTTGDDEVEINSTFSVFDANETNLTPSGAKKVLLNWFENLYHNAKDGNVTSSEIVFSKDYNSSNTQTGVSVESVSVNNQTLSIKIKRDVGVNFVVIHLMSKNLEQLWYSKFGNRYDVSDGSTCLNHFCIAVTWQNTTSSSEVGSGEFKGTESNVTEYNSTKTGVKIFR